MSSVELNIVDASGNKAGTRAASAIVFGGEKTASQLLHQAVRYERNKKRAGTHNVKTRAEVAGGGAKPWKQKGTGRARAGSNTSPLWVGGGVAHGPKQRSYAFSMNKKERRRALRDALSAKRANEKLLVIKDFGLSEAKTKAAQEVLVKLGLAANTKALVILAEDNKIAAKSLRNLAKVKVAVVDGLNVYDIVNAEYLLIQESEVAAIEARLA